MFIQEYKVQTKEEIKEVQQKLSKVAYYFEAIAMLFIIAAIPLMLVSFPTTIYLLLMGILTMVISGVYRQEKRYWDLVVRLDKRLK